MVHFTPAPTLFFSFTWDTKVADVLDDNFALYDDYVTRHVTVRDLLLHRTGVPRYDFLWFSGNYDREQILRYSQRLWGPACA